MREKAVGWLFEMNDWELLDFLPQLTQALKYETYHESALCRNLLERAMRNPRLMHHLFWSLALDLGTMEFGDRIEVVLNALLSACGAAQRQELRCQMNLLEGLEKVAIAVRGVAGAERAAVLQTELVELSGQLPSCFRLPLDPAAEVTGLCTEECSYFESNAVPLKLVFRNSDPRSNPLRIMFKYGDDLRQDAIVLQLIRIMDKVGGGGIIFCAGLVVISQHCFSLSLPPPLQLPPFQIWREESLDLRMITYQCLPMSPQSGMIELLDAVTLRQIHTAYGGVTGSFNDRILFQWLQDANPVPADFERASENFLASCAGYCVATYILGEPSPRSTFGADFCQLISLPRRRLRSLPARHLRPAQRQHHDAERRSHVPHRLWAVPRQCTNVWHHQARPRPFCAHLGHGLRHQRRRPALEPLSGWTKKKAGEGRGRGEGER